MLIAKWMLMALLKIAWSFKKQKTKAWTCRTVESPGVRETLGAHNVGSEEKLKDGRSLFMLFVCTMPQ